MNVEFKFDLGQEVKLPSGLNGIVESNSKTKNVTVNLILVEYFDKNGARFRQWFEEDRLEVVEKE